jgi:hypothetical protein
MGRILRIELRRSSAVGIAVLSLVLGTGLLLSFTQGFAGRWMQLAVAARLMLMVLWPLALAGGAWLGRREAHSRVDELFASTVRPRWQRVLPTACALAVAVVTAYTMMVLIGAVWVVPTAGYFPVTALVVAAVGALSLVAAAWLGIAAGRAVPRLVTAPVLAVAGLAVAGLLPDWVSASTLGGNSRAPAVLLLSPVFTGGLDDFETVMARVNLTQALWLAALAATGLLLAAAGRRVIALAALPAVLGAAVAVALLPSGGYVGATTADPGAVRLVCDDAGPQICVTRVHAGLLPDVAGPARQALKLMAAKLPNAPTRAVERSGARHHADTLVFSAPSIGPTGRAAFDDEPFLPSLLEAAWRQDCGDRAEHHDLLLSWTVAAGWLAGQPPTPASWWNPQDRERVDRAYQTLVALPPAEQQRRMASARDAALDCRPDALLSILPADTP